MDLNVSQVDAEFDVFKLPSRVGIVIDMTLPQGKLLMSWACKNSLFERRGLDWLILSDDKRGYNALSHDNSHVTIALVPLSRSNHVLPLFHFYPAQGKFGTDPKLRIVGYWSPGHQLEMVMDPNVEEFNLHGATLNITTLSQIYPYQNHQDHDLSLLHLLMDFLHFKLQINEAGNYIVSTDVRVLQQLGDKQADIGATSILVTGDRAELVDFTVAVGKFRPQLYYKVQSVHGARNIYVLPFSPDVWVSLFSLLLAITVALTFILGSETRLPDTGLTPVHSSNYRQRKLLHALSMQLPDETPDSIWDETPDSAGNKKKHEQQQDWDLGEVMLVTIGAISQQGSSRNPTTSAARTLFITLFVLAVLMYTSYSASVISLMSSAGPVTNTLHDILQDGSNMQLAFHNTHYYHYQFKMEHNAVSRKLNHIKQLPTFLDLPSGLDSVVEGGVAFCADVANAYTYLHRSRHSEDVLCSVGEVALLQGPGYQRAFALQRGSPYTSTINYGLLHLFENGLLSREKHRWFELQTLCQSSDSTHGTTFISIDLEDILPALKIMGYGILCALILLALECVMHYWSHGNSRWSLPAVEIQQRSLPQIRMKALLDHLDLQHPWKMEVAWNKFKRLLANGKQHLPFVH